MTAAAVSLVPSAEEEGAAFEFDAEFQTKIAALALRDPIFMQRVESILDPKHFTNVAEGALVRISLDYFKRYKACPDRVTMARLIKEARAAKVIRDDLVEGVKESFATLQRADTSGRDYAVDQVSDFARHQAMEAAILESAELLQSGKLSTADKTRQIEKRMKLAMEVGAATDLGTYDYWGEIDNRTQKRRDLLAGVIKPSGIPTGISELDAELEHGGWGIAELSLMMGAAKAGKSMSLGFFGKNASLCGHNAIYFTHEVSKDIIASRVDAAISEFAMRELKMHPNDVAAKIKAAQAKAGRFDIVEFPTGTCKVSDIRRVLDRFDAKSIRHTLVISDYLDIMAPEHRSNDPIENSKSIYVDFRALVQERQVAGLSATQTNREGAKKSVASMTDVAEDFNRIRIADLVISINASEDEKNCGEARLFFAASRNQKDGQTLHIKQDRERMIFISKVLGKF